MAKKIKIPEDKNIVEVPLEDAMPENYLPYAVEVAKDRALPDVRDGLKPVHRRILYGAYKLNATPDKPYYKSARIVGDILGKYHPHGDTSVYDALVILAQDFTTRYPLIDGHGNWGSIDGDSAAAMRYTEARLTPIALEMLKDIDKDVVNMQYNYSQTEMEPEVLPGRYPNLLVNGAFGIAVGLATNIPPHNLNEVIDGALAYIDNNNITTKELMNYIKGPDLPTGGIIIGQKAILSAYEKGEGKVVLRAKTSIEEIENGRLAIIINEFPYRKNKAKILQNISEMTADKKHSKYLEPITDIRDESDRNGIRAVIEFKKSTDEELARKVLKYLLKKTELQCNLSFNMVAICNGKPETITLKSYLIYYVEHQKEIIIRRTKKELEEAKKRFHIVEGFIKAIDIMDEIIALIRASKSKKDSENNLIKKYGFSEIQAKAIVELMLYKLTGLEIKIFEKEYKELDKKIKRLNKILESEKELFKVIKKELNYIKEQYGDERRTKIIEDDEKAVIDTEELVIEEDAMVTLSNEGFIKRISMKSYNRSNADVNEIEYREGDYNKFLFEINTKDNVILFTDEGNMYKIRGIDIPEHKWKEKGERLDYLIKSLNLSKENIIDCENIKDFNKDKYMLFITEQGMIKRTELNKFQTNYAKLQGIKMKKDEKLIYAKLFNADRKEEFIDIKISNGLNFTIKEPKIDTVDRNLKGYNLINLQENMKILNVELKEQFNYEPYKLKIDEKGNLSIKKGEKLNNNEKVDYEDVILIFDNLGNCYKFKSFMFQNLKGSINIKDLISINKIKENLKYSNSNININELKILKFLVVKSFYEYEYVYFFTKKGYVKSTKFEEFKDDFILCTAYKFKEKDDIILYIDFIKSKENLNDIKIKKLDGKSLEDIIIITKKGMAIRFNSSCVNPMGKIASGVTGINLKEKDEVIFASIISLDNKEIDEIALSSLKSKKLKDKITIKTNTNKVNKIHLKDIESQNRAGRGRPIIKKSEEEIIKNIKID